MRRKLILKYLNLVSRVIGCVSGIKNQYINNSLFFRLPCALLQSALTLMYPFTYMLQCPSFFYFIFLLISKLLSVIFYSSFFSKLDQLFFTLA